MAKKPRTKRKFCPLKVERTKLNHRLRHSAAVFVTGTGRKVEMVNLVSRKLEVIDMKLAAQMLTTTFEYTVHLYALCIDWQGTPYLKGEECAFTARYYQHDLVEFLNERHQRFLETNVSKKDMIAAAWIAVPVSKVEVTNETAFEIFDRVGGWLEGGVDGRYTSE